VKEQISDLLKSLGVLGMAHVEGIGSHKPEAEDFQDWISEDKLQTPIPISFFLLPAQVHSLHICEQPVSMICGNPGGKPTACRIDLMVSLWV
jgi:hypothetical protein